MLNDVSGRSCITSDAGNDNDEFTDDCACIFISMSPTVLSTVVTVSSFIAISNILPLTCITVLSLTMSLVVTTLPLYFYNIHN